MVKKYIAIVGIALFLFVFLAIPLINFEVEPLPDYENLKLIEGFTPSGVPTPYKTGSPQTCIDCVGSGG